MAHLPGHLDLWWPIWSPLGSCILRVLLLFLFDTKSPLDRQTHHPGWDHLDHGRLGLLVFQD